METNVTTATPLEGLEARWRLREHYWRRKLGRLRLGVEPIEDQLARYRRVTWALTAVPSVLGALFFALFTVFGRPGIGFIVVAVLLLPVVLLAWLDHLTLVSRARRYRHDVAAYLQERDRLGG
jgi:hypothetical protein